MAPRIVGGSNYDNPYENPVSSDLFGDKIFDAFDQQRAQEIKDDPIAEIKAEFEKAQRQQREPRPRKGVQL